MTKEIIGIGPAGKFAGKIDIFVTAGTNNQAIFNVSGTVNAILQYHYQTKFERSVLDIIDLLEPRIQLQLREMVDGEDKSVTQILQTRGYK